MGLGGALSGGLFLIPFISPLAARTDSVNVDLCLRIFHMVRPFGAQEGFTGSMGGTAVSHRSEYLMRKRYGREEGAQRKPYIGHG